MNTIQPAAAAYRTASFAARPVPAPLPAAEMVSGAAPQADRMPVEKAAARRDAAGAEAAAAAAAMIAARALYDPRVTGPSSGVANFDRMALVIEGFEHIREIFAGISEAVAEDFGTAGSLDKRV